MLFEAKRPQKPCYTMHHKLFIVYFHELYMDKTLPIFPLSLVVFPNEKLNLHIFEDRYKDLVNDCLNNHTTFGIPSYINGVLCEYGTEVEILSVERVYAKGEMDIRTRGIRVFRMENVESPLEDKTYAGAKVNWLTDTDNGDESFNEDVLDLLKELHGVLKVRKEELENAENMRMFQLAHYIGLSIEKEYELLCMLNERDRQLMVLQHLRTILPVAKETESLKDRIKANGHFKDITPPSF